MRFGPFLIVLLALAAGYVVMAVGCRCDDCRQPPCVECDDGRCKPAE